MKNKRENLETLKAALQKGEEKLRRAEREVKLLEEKRKAMTRKERTHRLCTHGAMLDRFLLDPDLLTEEDVLLVLKEAFSKEGVRQKLEEILSRRREEIIPNFVRAQLYTTLRGALRPAGGRLRQA